MASYTYTIKSTKNHILSILSDGFGRRNILDRPEKHIKLGMPALQTKTGVDCERILKKVSEKAIPYI